MKNQNFGIIKAGGSIGDSITIGDNVKISDFKIRTINSDVILQNVIKKIHENRIIQYKK